MIYFFTKLSHYYLKLYMVKKQIEPMLYHLKILSTLHRLHLVFPVVKLIAASINTISRRYTKSSHH